MTYELKIAVVLILLNVCHWLGDYTHLSTTEMLQAKRIGKPLLPIFCHAFTHSLLFFLLFCFFVDNASLIGICVLIELISHFGIDVLKGKMNVWFPSLANPVNKLHWYVFGLDQLLHQIVIIIIAISVVQK